MNWLQIAIEVSEENAATLEETLLALGAQSVSVISASDSELFEPLPGETPLWPQNWVMGLFPATTAADDILRQLQTQLGLREPPRHRVETLVDRDWIRAGTAALKPMRFGRRLWICPSGHAVSAPDAVVVRLDPGLAFGTGTHPSTALCLQALDERDLKGRSIIDYGCGSGILAVAAARLGARKVYAVDYDPQALQATQDNAARNDVQDCVHAISPDQLTVAPADLLIANILSGPLIQLASQFAGHVRPGGDLLLAGLLESDTQALRNAYAPWFELPQAECRDGWLRLSGTRLHGSKHG